MPSLMRVAPELQVKDMGASLRHYEEKLGFKVVMTLPDGEYAIVERDGVALHLFRNHAETQSPASIQADMPLSAGDGRCCGWSNSLSSPDDGSVSGRG